MSQAKRVVLRIPTPDMDYRDVYEPVRLYLSNNGGSVQELDEGRHFVHIQPPNDNIPQSNPKIHVIIDLEMDKFSGPLNEDFPHEFYRVRRADGMLTLQKYRESPWLVNYARILRSYTDKWYLWGGGKCSS